MLANGSVVKTHAKGGFFMKEDLALFDAPFFGMNQTEAMVCTIESRPIRTSLAS